MAFQPSIMVSVMETNGSETEQATTALEEINSIDTAADVESTRGDIEKTTEASGKADDDPVDVGAESLPLSKKDSHPNSQNTGKPSDNCDNASPNDDSDRWRRLGLFGAVTLPVLFVILMAMSLSLNGNSGRSSTRNSSSSSGADMDEATLTQQEETLQRELLELQQRYFGKQFVIGKRCGGGSIMGVTRILPDDRISRIIVPFGRTTLDEDDNPSHPISEDTLFEIGSISKPLTGLILADMIVEGVFGDAGLDTPLNDLLPSEVPDLKLQDGEDLVTLGNLLTHSAGFPRLSASLMAAAPEWNIFEDNPYAGYTEQDMIEDLTIASSVNVAETAPGTFSYSNFGFSVLAYILSRTADVPFDELQKNLTDRMGMNNTWIVPDVSSLPLEVRESLLSSGYDQGRKMPYWFNGGLYIDGAGSTLSSAKDLIQWVELLLLASTSSDLDAQLQEALQLSLSPVKAGLTESDGTNTDNVGIAYAWIFANHEPDQPSELSDIVYSHTGGTAGYATHATFQPSTRTAVIGMTNCAHMAEDLIDMVNVKVAELFQNATDSIF